MGKRNEMKKICFFIALFFIIGVFFHALPCFSDAQTASLEASGRMITDHLNEETPSQTNSTSPVQLHTFMIACLVVLGGALGMVLLNMKLGREDEFEQENEKDSL